MYLLAIIVLQLRAVTKYVASEASRQISKKKNPPPCKRPICWTVFYRFAGFNGVFSIRIDMCKSMANYAHLTEDYL